MRPDSSSRTAERVAARRAIHQIVDTPVVFNDPLATRILHPKIAAGLRDRVGRHERSILARYLRAFLVARSRIAEDQLAAAVARDVSQYVLLGAGFDTFAYRNPHPDLHVYELDHPATQLVKRRRLEYAQIAIPANVSYISADLGAVTLAQALASSTFDASRPAVFAWLGVVPYLELPAIKAILSYIASLPAGTEVIFDYGVPPPSLNFVARFFYRRIAKRVEEAGEPWKTFFTPPGIDEVLRECGFAIVNDLGANEINGRYFANRSDRLRVADVGHVVTAVVAANGGLTPDASKA